MSSITKETIICMSLAQRPSDFGTTVHNAGFESLGINAIYLARGLEPTGNNLRDAIHGIRALGIRGCGVSMPFKVDALNYMDRLDTSAIEVGAMNTIVNENGMLIGYNTDFFGATEALKGIGSIERKKVLVLGAGGVSLAITAALKHLGVTDVSICNRTYQKAHDLALKRGYSFIPWNNRNQYPADVLINATSIGMTPDFSETPVDEPAVENFKIIYEVVISPVDTLLIKLARKRNKVVIPGTVMCLLQAVKQFELYTDQEAPLEIMKSAMLRLLGQ